MSFDPVNISGERIAAIAGEFGTPVWIYDAAVIRAQIDKLRSFDMVRYAQKAFSNINVLRMMRAHGVMLDVVSVGELERGLMAGFETGNDSSEIMFTSDLLDRDALRRVVELGVQVNAGSLRMLEQIGELKPGHRVWVRINPGFGSGHSQKVNTGGENSKFGIWYDQLEDAYELIDKYDLDLVGMHMHIGSGANYEHLATVCDAMVDQVRRSNRDIRAISAGGGLPTPYREQDVPVDTAHYFRLWDCARKEIEGFVGHSVRLEIEPGRYLVAQSALLVAEVLAKKSTASNNFVLVDAGFNEFARPVLYGSYHRISILGSNHEFRNSESQATVVGGPLCESGDIFTQGQAGVVEPRLLPAAEPGDLVVFHDTGAYCSAMSSNYNSRPFAPEVLIDGDETRLIRRRQTIEEMIQYEQV